jgi:phage terminase small subunit
MARGRKPTPTWQKVIKGNPGKRPLPTNEPVATGAPVKPKWLKGRPSDLWDEVLKVAYWLSFLDSYKLAMWCDRQADFEDKRIRSTWNASDRREHRSLGAELGFDPSSRAKMAKDDPAALGRRTAGNPVPPAGDKATDGGEQKEDPASKYLN